MAPALEARHAVIQQKFGEAIQLRELKSALHSVVDLLDQPLEFIKDPCRVAQIKAATTAANALQVEVNGFTSKQCSAHWAGFLASSLSPPKHLLHIASVLAMVMSGRHMLGWTPLCLWLNGTFHVDRLDQHTVGKYYSESMKQFLVVELNSDAWRDALEESHGQFFRAVIDRKYFII